MNEETFMRNERSRKTTWLRWSAHAAAATAVALGCAAGTLGMATAATGPVAHSTAARSGSVPLQFPIAAGIVQSVNGSTTSTSCGTAATAGTFTLKTHNGTIDTVDVTDTPTATTFTVPGVTSPTFVNLCVGDGVTVDGTNASSTITATKVFVLPLKKPFPPLQFPIAAGIVQSVNGSTTSTSCGTAATAGTFTLKTHNGTIDTVDVTDTPTATTFTVPGVTSPTFVNLCVGDGVTVDGTNASSTITATKVFVLPLKKPFPPLQFPIAAGIVQSVNGSTTSTSCGTAATAGTFTLKTHNGTIDTVDVTVTPTATTFTVPGVTSPTFVNLCVGDGVTVDGTNASSTITATKVFVLPPKKPFPPLHSKGGHHGFGGFGSHHGRWGGAR